MRFKTVGILFLAQMIYLLMAQYSLAQESRHLSGAKNLDFIALERTKILNALYIENSGNKNFLKDPHSQSSEVRNEFLPTLKKIADGNFLGKSTEEVNRFMAAVNRARDRATSIDIAIAMKEDLKVYPKGCYEEAFRDNKNIIERVSLLKWKDDIAKEDAAVLLKVSLALAIEQAKLLKKAYEKVPSGRFMETFLQYEKEITGLANKNWRADKETENELNALNKVVLGNSIDLANALQSISKSITNPRFLDVFKANVKAIDKIAKKNWKTDEITHDEDKALFDVFRSYLEK